MFTSISTYITKLNRHKNLTTTSFADEVNIIIKSNKENNQAIKLGQITQVIEEWAKISEAKLSKEKTNVLHICNKRNCKAIIEGPTINKC